MHIVILGAGPSGVAAASEALDLGHRVTILDPEGLGGNALRHSLVPSKIVIRAAETIRSARQLGARWSTDDWVHVMNRQQELIQEGLRRVQAALREAQVIPEAGALESGREVVSQTSHTRLIPDVVIIAIGSRQRLIPDTKPDGERVWLPRIFQDLQRVPDEVAIVGAGATGLEAASFLGRLGVSVDLYTSSQRLLPKRDPAIAERLEASLLRDNVKVHTDRRIVKLQEAGTHSVRMEWTSGRAGSGVATHPHVLIAAGRAPVWKQEILEALGFTLDGNGFFQVDDVGRTNVAGVYAVGDAAGEPLLANQAWSQGWRAVRHAAGRSPEWPAGPVVHAVYTTPEVAWVGDVTAYRHESEMAPPWLYQPLLQEEQPPYVILYTDAAGRLVGGEMIGNHAAEVASLLGLAISAALPLEQLGAFQPASPTSAEWLAWMGKVEPRF